MARSVGRTAAGSHNSGGRAYGDPAQAADDLDNGFDGEGSGSAGAYGGSYGGGDLAQRPPHSPTQQDQGYGNRNGRAAFTTPHASVQRRGRNGIGSGIGAGLGSSGVAANAIAGTGGGSTRFVATAPLTHTSWETAASSSSRQRQREGADPAVLVMDDKLLDWRGGLERSRDKRVQGGGAAAAGAALLAESEADLAEAEGENAAMARLLREALAARDELEQRVWELAAERDTARAAAAAEAAQREEAEAAAAVAARVTAECAAMQRDMAAEDSGVGALMAELPRLRAELEAERLRAAGLAAAAEEERRQARELATRLDDMRRRLEDAEKRADESAIAAAKAAAANAAAAKAAGRRAAAAGAVADSAGGCIGGGGSGDAAAAALTAASEVGLQKELERTKAQLAEKARQLTEARGVAQSLLRTSGNSRSGGGGMAGRLTIGAFRFLYAALGWGGAAIAFWLFLANYTLYPRSVDVYRAAT